MAYSHAFFFSWEASQYLYKLMLHMRPAELFKSIVEHNKQKRLRRFMHSAEIDTRWGKAIDFCPV